MTGHWHIPIGNLVKVFDNEVGVVLRQGPCEKVDGVLSSVYWVRVSDVEMEIHEKFLTDLGRPNGSEAT